MLVVLSPSVLITLMVAAMVAVCAGHITYHSVGTRGRTAAIREARWGYYVAAVALLGLMAAHAEAQPIADTTTPSPHGGHWSPDQYHSGDPHANPFHTWF